MPTIQFYHTPQSPPCRAIEMVAGMIGVELDKRPLDLLAGDHLSDDYIKLNPLHTVPFIIDGELKLGESRAILMYLVNKYKSDDPLYPMDPNKRASIDELLFYEIGIVYPAHNALLWPMVLGGAKEFDREKERAYRDSLRYLDRRLGDYGGTKFPLVGCGDQLTIADISLVALLDLALDYSTVRDYDLSEFNNLLAYVERVRLTIPNYNEFNNIHRENIRQFIRSRHENN